MKARKLMALILAILVLTTVFVGCQPEEQEPAKTEEAQATTEEKEEVKEEVEIETLKILVPGQLIDFPDGVSLNDNYIVEKWEEDLGYDVEVTTLSTSDAADQLTLKMSSDDAGDVVVNRDINVVSKFAAADLLVPLEDYVPNTEYVKDLTAASKQIFTVDEHLIAVGMPMPRPGWTYPMGRKDFIEGAGYSTLPENKDELLDMFKALKTDDVIPFVAFGDPATSDGWVSIRSLFEIPVNYIVKDGEVVYSLITDEAKQYLEYATQMYQDGLVPQDFVALDANAAKDIVLANKGAVINSALWSNYATAKVIQDEYDGTFRAMPLPKSITGEKASGRVNRPVLSAAFLPKNTCQSPEAVMGFLDYLSQDEIVRFNNYGIEGTHYDMVDGEPVFKEGFPEGIKYKTYFANWWQPSYLWFNTVKYDSLESYCVSEDYIANRNLPADIYMPVIPEANITMSDIEDITKDFYTKVVMGNASIDEWDDFVNSWLDAGGQDILDQLNEMYVSLGSPEFFNNEIGKTRDFEGVLLWDSEAKLTK